MSTPLNRLADELKRGLAPLYVIAGDEPLQAGEAADAVRAAARAAGYDERESHVVINANHFKWDTCFADLDNLSLFASRRLFELRLPNGKPGREGAAALTALAADPPPDTLFIFHLPRLDKNTRKAKWAQSLEKAGVWVDVYLPEPAELPRLLAERATAAGLTFERDALLALVARTEGNLLAAQQEIERLALLLPGGTVTEEQVTNSVADGTRFDVYQLADAAAGQDLGRALRILCGLRREGTADALVAWALNRQVMLLLSVWCEVQNGATPDSALRKHRIWGKRVALFRKALRAHDESSLRRLTRRAAETDRVVKGAAFGLPAGAMQELVTALARPAAPGVRGWTMAESGAALTAGTDGPLAIMGGAFDPVHYGHLRTVAELRDVCGFAEVRLVPSANPPHRPPHIASPGLRLRMLEAALRSTPWCSIDSRELERSGPSWTVLTLEELRQEAGERSLCMMVGMDAFLSLRSWHRWEELPGLAHIVVAHRPGWQPPQSGELGDFVRAHQTFDVADLHERPSGRLFVHEVTQLEISSSAIRARIAAGESAEFLLPAEVLELALESGCYARPPTKENPTYA